MLSVFPIHDYNMRPEGNGENVKMTVREIVGIFFKLNCVLFLLT